MVGWHHQLNGHEFEQTPGDGEGQGSLVFCSPWGHQELGMTNAEKFGPIYVKINTYICTHNYDHVCSENFFDLEQKKT